MSALVFPSREKRWILPQQYWGEQSKQFFPLATIYTSKGQWCDEDYTEVVSVYVLVTKLPENSSAERIRCYPSTRWHKQVSADHSALYTDGG